MNTKKAFLKVLFWMGLAIIFNGVIFLIMGKEAGLQFFGGYIIELSLSMDNLFLFILVFEAYRISPIYQRRVLSYGIAGAIILRFIFIMLGVSVVNRFHWVLYIFGAVLLVSGIKMMFKDESNEEFRDSKILKGLGKIIPVTNRLYDEKFFVRIDKALYATPLFAILVLIELSDIIFAIDSIPAVFSITTEPFIVYTSNIFAILGLRSLYFVLEKLHHKFCYVKYGIALILCFTGIKLLMLIFNYEIALPVSLIVIFSILTLSIVVSWLFPERDSNYKRESLRNAK